MKALLDFIAKKESRGDYNVVWGGIDRNMRPARPLTEMTINEVLAWQDEIDPHYMSEAAGRYQILEDTLRGLYRQAGFNGSELFDEPTQDDLAVALLKRRGLDEWLGFEISTAKFANNLAKEWASLPVVSGPKVGRSYYDGDKAGNKSLTTVKAFLDVLEQVRPSQKVKPDPRTPGPFDALWAALSAFFKAIFGKEKT